MRSVLAVVLVLGALAGIARADTTYYYASTLPCDAVGLAAYAGGLMERGTSASTTLAVAGAAGALLATPVIHATRGHWKRGLASLGMRAGAALIATAVAPAHAVNAAGVGLGIASVIDAATLTRERTPARWTPNVAASRGGLALGIGKRW